MRVKLFTHRVGDGFDQPIGTVIDVPKREALALLNAGSADPVGNTRRIETPPPHPIGGTLLCPRPVSTGGSVK